MDRPTAGPDPADVALFPAPDHVRDEPTVAVGPVTHRRPKRPGRAIAIGGAVLAVAGSAVLAGALTSGNGNTDETLPDGDQPTAVAPSGEPPDSDDPTAPSGSPSPTSAPPSPSRSDSDISGTKRPGPPSSARPSSAPASSGTATSPTTPTSPAPQPPGNGRPPRANGTLRQGDSGAEVAELQLRLIQLHMYAEEADGVYDNEVKYAVYRYQSGYGVKGDPDGVYGPRTRRSLESRTEEPWASPG